MCSVVAFASGVDSADVTVFEEGAPADAASMNANFQALVNAINISAQQIEAHEERIAALESDSGAGVGATLSNIVAGNTYSFAVFGVIHRSGTNGYNSVNNYSQTYTASFNDDDTVSITGFDNESELGLFLGQREDADGILYDFLDSELKQQAGNTPFSIQVAYSQAGPTVTVPDLDLVLKVAFDGKVLVGSGFQTGNESQGFVYSESNLLVGIEVL
jgi:hypothetical protein